MSQLSWPDDRVAELRRLFDEGRSSRVIAKHLGISKGAVLGKIHRLGLSYEKNTKSMEDARRAADERRERHNEGKRRIYAEHAAEREAQAVQLMRDKFASFRGHLGIPFADLAPLKSNESNQCRYMAAEEPGPDYRVCGNETEPGQSWCPHCKVVVHDYRKLSDADQARIRNLARRIRVAGAGSAA